MASSVVITIENPQGDPVEDIEIEILDGTTKNCVGRLGPSDSNGKVFTVLEVGGYFIALPASPFYSAAGFKSIDVVAGYQEFTYQIRPIIDGTESIAEIFRRVEILEKKLTRIGDIQNKSLKKTQQDNLVTYFDQILTEVRGLEKDCGSKYRQYQDYLLSVIHNSGKDYWKDPVVTVGDLPNSDKSYVLRSVMDEDGAIYFNDPTDGWKKVE